MRELLAVKCSAQSVAQPWQGSLPGCIAPRGRLLHPQFSSVAQLCLTLCDPMNRSTPGLPVHHQHPEFTKTHVYRVSDAIQPSHPLPLPSLWPSIFPSNKRRLYTWTSPDGQYLNQIDYILCSQRRRSSIKSAKTRLGADCSSDHKLIMAKFRHKLKKVGKTTRPFRYDLNQIPYDYTVDMRNRFKVLDLIGRKPEKLWTEVMGQGHAQEREVQKSKMVV